MSLVGHVDGVELVDDIGEDARGGHHEGGVLHVVAVGAAALAVVCRRWPRVLMKGKALSRTVVNISSGEVSLKRDQRRLILFRREDGVLDGLLEAIGLVFLEGVELVQALDKEQVGELLDDGEGVGDAAGPERVPDAVDFGFDFASDHWMGMGLAGWFWGVEAGFRGG